MSPLSPSGQEGEDAGEGGVRGRGGRSVTVFCSSLSRIVFHRFGVGFAVDENSLDAGLPRGWHDCLDGQFAAWIARAFAHIVPFQAIADMDGVRRGPRWPKVLAFEQDFVRARLKPIGAGPAHFMKLAVGLKSDIERHSM